jgi:hypothetical protein
VEPRNQPPFLLAESFKLPARKKKFKMESLMRNENVGRITGSEEKLFLF